MRRLLLACMLLAACGLDGEVGQSGEYAFLPGASVTDTAGRPLSELLLVEEDRPLERARLYLFDGELGAAGLGIADLRRLARHQGRFDMAFDPSTAQLPSETPSTDDGARELRVGEREVPLATLDDEGLRATGASRFLRTLDSQDYAVRAHFGVLELAPEEALSTLALADSNLRFTPKLAAAPLTFSVEPDEERIALRYGELPGADYLVIELLQRIVRDDGTTEADDGGALDGDGDGGVAEPEVLDAMVRTTLAPGGEYLAGFELFTDVFGRGCWSRERPVIARLTQVDRDYQQTPEGDRAVEHRRTDALVLEPEQWLEALGEPAAASYCDQFRPGPP